MTWRIAGALGLLLLFLLLATTVSAAEPPESGRPSAFERLERVRAHYGGLEAYLETGTLEVRAGPDDGELLGRFAVSALRTPDGFRLELVREAAVNGLAGAGEPRRLVLWRDADGTFLFDSARGEAGEYRQFDSSVAALAELPGGRELGVEAFPIAALLAGGPDALARPPAASVDGPEPCPGEPAAACWRLRHPSPGGHLETELWLEGSGDVVRQVEVRTVADPLGFGAALAAAGLDPGLRPPTDARQLVVRTTIAESGAPSAGAVARLAAGPPPAARRVELWTGGAGSAVAGEEPQIGFGETIDVALAGFVVRVLDRRGDPVTGLGPDDFLVTAGDRRVPVRSVDFYATGSGSLAEPTRAAAPEPRGGDPSVRPSPPSSSPSSPPPPELPPKIVVLYVQADFNSLRTRGHLKMLPFVERFLASLPADDLVAVVSFDSHLEPWLDLTTDRKAAREAVWRAIHFGADPPAGRRIERRRGPSLFAGIEPDEAADAAWAETGLAIVGRALLPLPGEKVVVFLGWGLGRYGFGGVTMRRDYRPAVEALTAARASVFVLDVADAAYHDLEIGLRRVAAATGGTYEKTSEFPLQATRRLVAILASHYVLTVDLSDLPADLRQRRGELDVQLVGHGGVRLLVRPLGGG